MNLQFGYCIAFLLVIATRFSEAVEPEFGASIPALQIVAGHNAVLKCIVNNLGEFKVAWINVQNQVILSINTHVILSMNPRVTVSNPHPNAWWLELKDVTPEDTGFYMCQVNTEPMKSQVGYLNVVVPPEFSNNMTNRNVTVLENSNVTISCKATGNPVPEIIWKREDEQPFITHGQQVRQYVGDELMIAGVTRQHMAAYLCAASNGIPPAISRRIYLDVTFPPLIYIPNQLVGAAERSNVTLDCYTEAHPSSSNEWLKDGDHTLPKNERYATQLSTNSYKIHMRLTIRYLMPGDYGSYKCLAKNEIGETEGSITLYKLRMPPPTTRSTSTEEPPTRASIKSTITATTDGRAVTFETERRNHSNSPGFQQKYGEYGRSLQKPMTSTASHNVSGVLFMAIVISTSVISIHRR